MHPGSLERPGPVPRGREGVHQAERHAGVERIERREPAPPRGRVDVLADRGRIGGEPFERLRGALSQPASLGLHPALELRRVAQIEAVQERPSVELGGRRIVATLEGVLEGLHVARDDGRIQRELRRAEQEIGLMKVAAQGVASLLQEAARVLGVGVGPQVGDELVTAEAALARCGEEGEEREGLPLLRGSAHGHPV